jgi:microcystin-dependent protein
LSLSYRIVTGGIFPSSGPPDGPIPSVPYVGQIFLDGLGSTFTMTGTQRCDGTLLNILDYVALFSLIGTQFGGDGSVTFAVPDLRDHSAIGFSGTYPIGSTGP